MSNRDPARPYPYPIAPTEAEWEALSDEQRARVVAALPTGSALRFAADSTAHFKATSGTVDLLEQWFRRRGRGAFVAGNMGAHYPGERMIVPDVLVVLDVDPKPRTSWVVSHERKGLDWVLEVHAHGDHAKDVVDNPVRYAKLGIPEYFVFDAARGLVHAFRLPDSGLPRYIPIVPQGGVWHSSVLGLGLQVAGGRLRFTIEGSPILDSVKQVERLERMVDDSVAARLEEQRQREEAQRQREEAQRQREEAQRERDDEQRRREGLERELAALKAQLETLKGS